MRPTLGQNLFPLTNGSGNAASSREYGCGQSAAAIASAVCGAAFLSSTTREAVPIVTVNDRTIGSGKPGPVTWKLLEGFRRAADAS